MIERSFAFGPGEGLVATVCLPEAGPPARVGKILFNAGVVHRVGPHRINVRLARRLARRGIPSIRFDLSGQGDSARAQGALAFEDQAVADLRLAMDALSSHANVDRFSLFGFCSGGCHAYLTAKADQRVAGVILYDTYIYQTPKSRLMRYLLPLRERGVTGTLARMPAALAARRQARSNTAAQSDILLFKVPSKAEFAATVRDLHARGTKVGIVMSGSFREQYNYREQFRDAFAGTGIGEGVTYDFFPGMAHTAMRLDEQAAFMDLIERWTSELSERLGRGNAAS